MIGASRWSSQNGLKACTRRSELPESATLRAAAPLLAPGGEGARAQPPKSPK